MDVPTSTYISQPYLRKKPEPSGIMDRGHQAKVQESRACSRLQQHSNGSHPVCHHGTMQRRLAIIAILNKHNQD